MIVADTNLIGARMIRGDLTDAAFALLEEDDDWRVPKLWRYEILNILATYVKAKRMRREDAESAYAAALEVFAPRERDPSPFTALRIVERFSISGYDATFVALAQELEAPLYTRDRELLCKFPETTFRFGP